MTTNYTFIAAPYRDLSRADADGEAVRRLLDGLSSPVAFDCMILGRKASGEVRFHWDPGGDRAVASSSRPGSSLSAALALALFPSVAGDVPVSRLMHREILGATAGVVARTLGRSDIRDLGLSLDVSAAGLIAVTVLPIEDSVRSLLINAQSSMSRHASIDVGEIERAAGRIAARYRPRDG